MRLSFHTFARQCPLPDKPARIPRSVIHLNRLPNLTGQPQRLLPEPLPTGKSYYRSPCQSQLTAGQAKLFMQQASVGNTYHYEAVRPVEAGTVHRTRTRHGQLGSAMHRSWFP